MIRVEQIKTRLQLLENAEFILHAIAKNCEENHSLERIMELFNMLRGTIERDDVSAWIQFQGDRPLAFVAANILTELGGEKSCWAFLLYSTPGARIIELLENEFMPWAREQGTTKIQGANGIFESKRARAKNYWFNRMGFRKTFEVYERKVIYE